MINVNDIISKLDWLNSKDIQRKGIELAKEIKDLWMFVQPMKEEYNKSIWSNCAEILVKNSDKELAPYYIPLLEWLQDLNWPGAMTILERLKKVKTELIVNQYSYCVMRATEQKDEVWLSNLALILANKTLFSNLSYETKNILKELI